MVAAAAAAVPGGSGGGGNGVLSHGACAHHTPGVLSNVSSSPQSVAPATAHHGFSSRPSHEAHTVP